MPERSQFGIALIAYRCLHGMAPPYLTELLAPIAASARRLGRRSATTNNLIVPRVKLVAYGGRAFVVAGPACWNGLPNYLKESDLTFDLFKRQRKTHLFLLIKNLLLLRYRLAR
jgi:hypothetical protein